MNNQSNIILPTKCFFGYALLALGLSTLIAWSPIWGIWVTLSLILAIWTRDNDLYFLWAILGLMILGPVGRFLSPGTLVGSLWGFDFLLFFGLFFRISRFWPIRLGVAGYFVLFSIIGLIGSCFIFPITVVLKGSLYTVRWLVYYLVVVGTVGSGGNSKAFGIVSRVLGIVGLGLVIVGFLQLQLLPNISQELVHRFAFDPHVGRLFSTWFDPNYLGGFLVLALILSLGDGSRYRGERLAVEIFKMLIIGAGILLTFSRSSWLALLVSLFIFFVATKPKLLLAVVSLSIILGVFVLPVRQRIEGAIELDITARQRISNWQNAWQIIGSNPIVGVGYNLYEEAGARLGQKFRAENMPYKPAARSSDSSLLTVWATSGIGGLLVYLLLFWQIFEFGSIAEKSALAALLIHSLFVNSLLLPPFMLVFWIIYHTSQSRIQAEVLDTLIRNREH